MAKQASQRTYIFVNPNTPKAVKRQLQKIIIDKLLAKGATDK